MNRSLTKKKKLILEELSIDKYFSNKKKIKIFEQNLTKRILFFFFVDHSHFNPPPTSTMSQGEEVPVDVPRSDIFQTFSGAAASHDEKRRAVSEVLSFQQHHYSLILDFGKSYDHERIHHNQSRDPCFNCGRGAEHQIFFYPESQDRQTLEFTMNPLAHCRPECAYATVERLPDNSRLLILLALFYGPIACAPDRSILFLGTPLSVYHEMVDRRIFMARETPHRRFTFAPTIYATTMLNVNYQLDPETVSNVDKLRHQGGHDVLGPVYERNAENERPATVTQLPPKPLHHSHLSHVLEVDQASFRAQTQGNIHMNVTQDMDT